MLKDCVIVYLLNQPPNQQEDCDSDVFCSVLFLLASIKAEATSIPSTDASWLWYNNELKEKVTEESKITFVDCGGIFNNSGVTSIVSIGTVFFQPEGVE